MCFESEELQDIFDSVILKYPMNTLFFLFLLQILREDWFDIHLNFR